MAATNRSANAVRSAAPRFLRTPEGGGFRAEVFMTSLHCWSKLKRLDCASSLGAFGFSARAKGYTKRVTSPLLRSLEKSDSHPFTKYERRNRNKFPPRCTQLIQRLPIKFMLCSE